MAKQLQLRRGTTAENELFTGAIAEVTYDTDKKILRVHDGVTAGGNLVVQPNISEWSNNVTNCLTEIPQDIKLELNSGTLTLKAGSKVYVPNGTGVFDVVTIANDIGLSNIWGTAERMAFFVKQDGTSIEMCGLIRLSSGGTAPTATNTQFWYDTTNNLIKKYSGGADTGERYSFPIALGTKTSASDDYLIASIDQVFNGFGYIGSTVFALPGVKCLVPNGRNTDGTLNSTIVTVSSVKTASGGSADQKNIIFAINSNGDMPLNGNAIYDEKNNCCLDGTVIVYQCFCGSFDKTSEKINNYKVKTTFHAVDFSNIVNWGTPDYFSATTISAYPYTAPKNGFVFIYTKRANDQKTNIKINGTQVGYSQSYYSNIQYFFPVSTGDIISSDYSGNLQQGLFFPLKGVA